MEEPTWRCMVFVVIVGKERALCVGVANILTLSLVHNICYCQHLVPSLRSAGVLLDALPWLQHCALCEGEYDEYDC